MRALLMFFLIAGVGCVDPTPKLPYSGQSAVTDSLLEFRDKGPADAEIELSDFTPFRWDIMYCFHPGTKKADIDGALGTNFLSSLTGVLTRRYEGLGPLLVFTEDGNVVHAVVANPPLSVNGKNMGRYPYDTAFVQARCSKPTGPFVLNLQTKKRVESD